MTASAHSHSGPTTPLLSETALGPESSTPTPTTLLTRCSSPVPSPPKSRTPLPKFQLFILCIVMLAEPVNYTQIFPYVNDMCIRLGYAKSEKEVGFISGLIDSLFAIVQLFTIIHWGRLSDYIGRKPVLISGLCGGASCTLLFGFSHSLWLTIFARLLGGALSGNLVVCQSIVSEITDETNEAQAFALISLMWAVGVIVGTSVGGTFSRPAEQFPRIFDTPFWRTNAYLLPCLIAACISTVACLSAITFLRETHPRKLAERAARQKQVQAGKGVLGTALSYGTISEHEPTEVGPLRPTISELEAQAHSPPTKDAPFSYIQILRSPGVAKALASSFLMMFINQAWDVVFILWAYTSIRLGGLSMSPLELGYCLASAGAVGACIQMLVFPRVQRATGLVLYPWLLGVVALQFIGAPGLHWWVSLWGVDRPRGELVPSTYVGALILLWLGRVAAMIFPLNFIVLKRVAPSKSSVASTYGCAQVVNAGARAISPWFVSSLFAISVQHNLLGGDLMWAVMLLLTLGAVGFTRGLPGWVTEAERAREKRELDEPVPVPAGEV
ncbi:MFS general substrate transporter [Dacryopinax primogenitus]|uniref:MFS general substrate transporter n=1 Tax=Dacryopinax primogenitus (strain DJM 731) TaxID=1858805 RepID=M5G7K6_DACPD|nr:MFS general substrate transporter [Dacryopinax primogenitus]EJT99757.1 MFS general substrate transporter [Dacryopinax primogenitus]